MTITTHPPRHITRKRWRRAAEAALIFTALAAVGLAVGAVLVEAIEAAANEILREIRP